MEKVIIFGAKLFAELTYFNLTHDSSYEAAAFTVDRKYMIEDELLGLPVVPFEDVESLFLPAEYKMILPISFQRVNRLREEKYYQARAKGYDLISYVSSKASAWPGLATGDNCMIGENSIVEPYAKIGCNVIVTSCVMIGHHSVIGDHSFIGPGAMILGGVKVQSHCLIGSNATIKENVTIARECIIGAGVSITKNTQERGVYVNPPAILHAKRSNELRDWLMWSADPRKPRWGSGREDKQTS